MLIHDILVKLGLIKQNRMFKRLQRLYQYTLLDEMEHLDRIKFCYIQAWNAYKQIWFDTPFFDKQKFYFQSNLGTVQIELQLGVNLYKLNYSNYAGTKVFTITAEEDKIDVEPHLGDNLTAEEVDLALLELEEYLIKELGTFEDIQNAKEEERDKHKEELKKLM